MRRSFIPKLRSHVTFEEASRAEVSVVIDFGLRGKEFLEAFGLWFERVEVWDSKWNERAYFITRKVKLDHECLSMAVLVQEVINADYAFVIHTTNPSSGDALEIYAEV
ncbi:hypothetical protein Ahy_A08g037495 [Arachis hypogaea]|uniref:Pyruvate phosphate dikinase AMP/ATP-binding domain-containing protein n=1 Tax=Arachis hypogaea TaxID=3818 RepID=A0A445BQY6_ARAHY|nr:hypothetical protein Ahy_A08g037495 [Arachis hypogaea]